MKWIAYCHNSTAKVRKELKEIEENACPTRKLKRGIWCAHEDGN
jgi:hypothetical protein